MISNQILQDTIDGIKAITRIDLCVMDTEGKPLASTLDAVEEYKEAVLVFAESLAESQALQGYQFFKVFDENQLEYIILVKGETDDVYMVGKMAAFQVQNLLIAYKERFDKDNFIKNLLLDNLLLVDIYNRAKKLHIETDVRRCVFIVETKNDRDNNVIAYSRLGIGRLIYQLPLPLCKMFIKEIFDGRSPDEFDEETLQTINKFFENNLNVSETSRQLYIHRNTLVYRLDKLQKSTGLDLRVFEDAITFKIALMVVKYMKYMESIEY